MTKTEFESVMHQIAQAGVNMAEGKHNLFEPGCRAQCAIERLCEAIQAGEVGVLSKTLTEKETAIVENALVHHAKALRNAAEQATDANSRNAFTYDAEDTEALIERFE